MDTKSNTSAQKKIVLWGLVLLFVLLVGMFTSSLAGPSGISGLWDVFLPIAFKGSTPTPTNTPVPTNTTSPFQPVYWQGTTNQSRPMSFYVTYDKTEWYDFALEYYFEVDACGGHIIITTTVHLPGPGDIVNKHFSGSSSDFAYNG